MRKIEKLEQCVARHLSCTCHARHACMLLTLNWPSILPTALPLSCYHTICNYSNLAGIGSMYVRRRLRTCTSSVVSGCVQTVLWSASDAW